MSLAARLREALARGAARSVSLLQGDSGAEDASAAIAAAVLFPIVDRPEPTVILTLRPSAMRRHGGQIALPGGRIDPGDEGPIEASLREAEEEIGLARQHVEVIGTTDRYRTITGFDVTPVIGVVPPGLRLSLHPAEVEAVFEAPLTHLLDPANQIERSALWQGRERRYFEIHWQDRRIWGATAAMIVNLSRRLDFAA